MPSPVGHVLAGTAVYLAGAKQSPRSGVVLAAAVLGSLVPDLDFLPGILIGDLRAFHHGISHSFSFSVIFGALVFLCTRYANRSAALQASALGTVSYASHVILDFVSVNEGTRGVPLLWPLSAHEFGYSLHLFGRFLYGDISQGIWGVVRWANLSPFLRELSILGTVVVVLLRKEQLRNGVRTLQSRMSKGLR